MSFKRDGNDSGLLSVLKKRRIKDLLAEDIPEDEAKLLANGRFTCLVCNSHPIFDTVDMLCVHRNGKRHQASVDYHKKKKEELKQLIAKRRHEQFVKTGSDSIRMGQSHYLGISAASPYNSRTRRHTKGKSGDRKQCIDLHPTVDAVTESNIDSCNPPSHSIPNTNSCEGSTPWQKICEHQIHNGPIKHESQLKNIFGKRSVDEPVRLHPYFSSKRKTVTNSSSDSNQSCRFKRMSVTSSSGSDLFPEQSPACVFSTSGTTITNHIAPHLSSVNSQSIDQFPSRHVGNTLNMCPSPLSSSKFDYTAASNAMQQNFSNAFVLPPPKTNPPAFETQNRFGARHLGACLDTVSQPSLSISSFTTTRHHDSSLLPPPPPPPPENTQESSYKEDLSSPRPQVLQSHSSLTSSQRSLALKYHHLQGSGWKKDWDGKWVKDDNAEFDSDEEPPDLP